MHIRAIDIENRDTCPIYHVLPATCAGEQRIPMGTPQWK